MSSKAIEITATGGPDVLVLRDVETPVPAPGQALIRIEASGVNFIDVYVREGRYSAQLPLIPGQEAAGTVVSVGDGVTSVKPGDRVAWCSVLGTYAEYAVAPADRLVAVPAGISSEQAAAAMLQGMTAHYLSYTTYPIRKGDEVLIHAGAGGVGLLLTQMAKSLGARVFTTVSTEEKAALSREAGADVVINYRTDDFAAEVRKQSAGLHAVYDSVGKTTFEQSLSVLRPRGMMVLYGGSSGAVPPFDIMKLAAMGSLFLTRPTLPAYTASREELETRATDVLQAIAKGTLKLRLEHTYPLAEAAQAHRDLEGRKTTGKILLVP
jgi:NADPH:quinone reductase